MAIPPPELGHIDLPELPIFSGKNKQLRQLKFAGALRSSRGMTTAEKTLRRHSHPSGLAEKSRVHRHRYSCSPLCSKTIRPLSFRSPTVPTTNKTACSCSGATPTASAASPTPSILSAVLRWRISRRPVGSPREWETPDRGYPEGCRGSWTWRRGRGDKRGQRRMPAPPSPACRRSPAKSSLGCWGAVFLTPTSPISSSALPCISSPSSPAVPLRR